MPVTTAPNNKPATASGPSKTPRTIGAATAILAVFHSSLIEATVAIVFVAAFVTIIPGL